MKRSRKFILRSIEILLAAGIVACIASSLYIQHLNRLEADRSRALADQYTVPEPAPPLVPAEDSAPDTFVPLTFSINADFEALQADNSDTKGWISIPDTEINYPILQGKTNDTYLRLGFDKQFARAGSIFFDCKIDLTKQPDVFLAYGHTMGSKSSLMFSPLLGYKEKDFWERHPEIYLSLPDECAIEGIKSNTEHGNEYTFTIFAVCLVDAFSSKEIAEHYSLAFDNPDEFSSYTETLRQQSIYDIPMDGTPAKLLALSTCASPGANSDTRLVVYGGLFTAH